MKTTFNSAAEIFDELDATRARLDETLARVGHRERERGAQGDGWCVAEIVEHLATVEQGVGRLAGMLLQKAGEGGGEAAWPLSLDGIAERARGEKYKAPESIAPRGGVRLADSHARLREARAALLALRPQVERAGAAPARYPHPIFGPLDIYQWLAVHNFHEERHRRQIERILGAEGN